MRTMNHVRDHVYGIVAHPTMSAIEKADMLKRLADADAQAGAISSTAVPMPQPAMSLPPAHQGPPTAAFPDAPPAAQPMTAGLAPPPTAAFPSLPPPQQDAGNEIDRQRMLALAALSQPTTYPIIR